MKKKDNLMKTVTIMLVITMLALIAIAGTYAKYTDARTGTATAVIGKWDIDFLNGDTPLEEGFTVDLAETMTGNDKANTFIQPGSKGEFTIKVTNNSEVPATVTAEVTDSSNSVFTSGQFTLSTDGTTTEGVVINPNASKDVKITWEWKYDHNTGSADEEDTTLGEAAVANAEAKTICTFNLTATQVNPNPAG